MRQSPSQNFLLVAKDALCMHIGQSFYSSRARFKVQDALYILLIANPSGERLANIHILAINLYNILIVAM